MESYIENWLKDIIQRYLGSSPSTIKRQQVREVMFHAIYLGEFFQIYANKTFGKIFYDTWFFTNETIRKYFPSGTDITTKESNHLTIEDICDKIKDITLRILKG